MTESQTSSVRPKRKLPLQYILGGVALAVLAVGALVAFYLTTQQNLDVRQQANVAAGCDNGVPIGGTACQSQNDTKQYRCGAGSTPGHSNWTAESCGSGRCIGSSCQAVTTTNTGSNSICNGGATSCQGQAVGTIQSYGPSNLTCQCQLTTGTQCACNPYGQNLAGTCQSGSTRPSGCACTVATQCASGTCVGGTCGGTGGTSGSGTGGNTVNFSCPQFNGNAQLCGQNGCQYHASDGSCTNSNVTSVGFTCSNYNGQAQLCGQNGCQYHTSDGTCTSTTGGTNTSQTKTCYTNVVNGCGVVTVAGNTDCPSGSFSSQQPGCSYNNSSQVKNCYTNVANGCGMVTVSANTDCPSGSFSSQQPGCTYTASAQPKLCYTNVTNGCGIVTVSSSSSCPSGSFSNQQPGCSTSTSGSTKTCYTNVANSCATVVVAASEACPLGSFSSQQPGCTYISSGSSSSTGTGGLTDGFTEGKVCSSSYPTAQACFGRSPGTHVAASSCTCQSSPTSATLCACVPDPGTQANAGLGNVICKKDNPSICQGYSTGNAGYDQEIGSQNGVCSAYDKCAPTTQAGLSCAGKVRLSNGEPSHGGFIGCNGAQNCFCAGTDVPVGGTYTASAGNVQCYPDANNDSCGANGTGPVANSTPGSSTPSTPSTPSAPMCLKITMNGTPTVGQSVTFTCGQVTGADHYEFRVKLPDGTIQNLAAASSPNNLSKSLSVTQAGDYAAQCRICTGADASTCQGFDSF